MAGINALLGTDEEAMLAVQEARRTCGELGVEIGTHRRRSSTASSVLRSPLSSQLLRRLSLGSTASSSRAESSCAESSQSSCEGSSCESSPSPCAAYQPPNTHASFMHTAYLHHLARLCTPLTPRRLPGSSQRTVHRRASAPVDSRRGGEGAASRQGAEAHLGRKGRVTAFSGTGHGIVRASNGFDWDSDDEEGTEGRERLSSPMSKVVRLQSVDL